MFEGTERYEVIRSLGAGAFGAVYEVRDRTLDRVVALKTMDRSSAGGLIAFKREFRRFADLRHDNVVRLHELEQIGEVAFFTMERVDRAVTWLDHVAAAAGDADVLADTVRDDASSPRYDEPRLLRSLAQLMAGLDAIHGIGFVHRDVKPANVLVDGSGCVKVLDFGIAGAEDSSDHTRTQGGFRGTPLYMAPEQTDRLPLTEMADWYAVGAMLFQAVAGVPPFTGTLIAMIGKKVTGDFAQADAAPGQATILLDIARELMAPAPEDRVAAVARLRSLVASSADERGEAATASTTGGGADGGPADSEPVVRCVGREGELDTLAERLARTRDGVPRITLMVAESGVGKSTVLRELARRVREGGAWAFAGRSGPRESIPFKALDPVVDALAEGLATLTDGDVAALLPRDIRAVAELFPALLRIPRVAAAAPTRLGASRQELLAVATNALSELLGRMADGRPVTLIFDDVQWGDRDSVSVLGALLSGPRPPACHFIFAARREELDRSEVLQELRETLDPFDVETLELEPLSEETCVQIARDALGDDVPVEALAKAAEGNAFFLDLLLRAAADRADADSPVLKEGVDLLALIERRIDALAPPSLDVLRAIGLAGRAVPTRLLRRTTRRSKAEVSEALDELVGRGLVRRAAATTSLFEPYHDRVLEAVQRGLTPADARGLHAALAEAARVVAEAEDREPDPEFVFTQLILAERLAEAHLFALPAFVQARQANALRHAASLARAGIRCARAAGVSARGHYSRLAHVQGELLQYDEVLATLEEGERACETDHEELVRRRGLTLNHLGRLREGERALSEPLRRMGVRIPKTRLGIWLSAALSLLYFAVARPFARVERRDAGASPDCVFLHFLSTSYFLHDAALSIWATGVALRHTIRCGRRDDFQLGVGTLKTASAGFLGIRGAAVPQELDRIEDPVVRVFAETTAMLSSMMGGRVGDIAKYHQRSMSGILRVDPAKLYLDLSAMHAPGLMTGRIFDQASVAAARIQMTPSVPRLLRMQYAIRTVGDLVGLPSQPMPFATSSGDVASLWLEYQAATWVAGYRGTADELVPLSPIVRRAAPVGVRTFLSLTGEALRLSAYRDGTDLPSSRPLRKLARKLPGAFGDMARGHLAGHASIRGDLERAEELLQELIPRYDEWGAEHYAAAARTHLATLVEATDPTRAAALRAEANPYFEREHTPDRVRFSLAILPGFRELYAGRADLDERLDGPELLRWARAELAAPHPGAT